MGAAHLVALEGMAGASPATTALGTSLRSFRKGMTKDERSDVQSSVVAGLAPAMLASLHGRSAKTWGKPGGNTVSRQ